MQHPTYGISLGNCYGKRIFILRNRQHVGRADNSFINQDEFVAMKTLSDCKSPRCDKHQFRDKMTVRT